MFIYIHVSNVLRKSQFINLSELFILLITKKGEMICMYKALVFLYPLRNRAKYSYYLPNKYNFSFDLYYFIILAMLAYIPGKLRLWIAQRDALFIVSSLFLISFGY